MSEVTLTVPAMAATANLAKIVNLIESNVKPEEPSSSHSPAPELTGVRFGTGPRRATHSSYVPKTPQLEEIVFTKPTFTERFARYFVIVVYLCGLCSLGFFLSIYHVFFWDSRMPPVFKGQKKAPAFG